MEKDAYILHSLVELKKPHPCKHKTAIFEVVRLGADIRIKCTGCGNTMLFPREEFNLKIKRIIKK